MKKLYLALLVLVLCAAPFTVSADSHIITPQDGTVIADLAPTDAACSDAWGRAIINYQKGNDTFQIQLNVKGLEPDMEYSLFFMALGQSERAEFPFMTDARGNGRLHLQITADELVNFDRVNVREYKTENSAWLSTTRPGGNLRQVPSQRNK